ncbi:MAG: hypothetical protein J6U68_01120 [Clostridia bacterium]|nr:hypothetical protein [Clostridia bacterium]
MQKTNYFELLEELASLSTRAVFLATGGSRQLLQKAQAEINSLRLRASETVCSLELSLFTDFLPPLERRSIAEAAHKISKIIERSSQVIFQKLQRPSYDKRSKESDVSLKLAELLEKELSLLKKIKKPNQTPDVIKFRKILNEARTLSRSSQKKQTPYALSMSELREELSDCFDAIVEIMLCNI